MLFEKIYYFYAFIDNIEFEPIICYVNVYMMIS
jgi:hypothetical protein